MPSLLLVSLVGDDGVYDANSRLRAPRSTSFGFPTITRDVHGVPKHAIYHQNSALILFMLINSTLGNNMHGT